MAYPGHRLAYSVRRAMRPLLSHTYTRIAPVVVTDPDTGDPVLDDWGNEVTEAGTPVSGLACVYLSQRRLRVDEGGRVLIDVPTLYVLPDDPLAVGDTVSSVLDKEGTVILLSALVESFDPSAEAGASVLKVAILRGAQTTP